MNLTAVFHCLLSLSLLGSISAAGLLLIKLFFRSKLSAAWHYAIWFALVLRLVIPLTPTIPFQVWSLLPQDSSVIDLAQVSREFSREFFREFSPAPVNVNADLVPPDTGTSKMTTGGLTSDTAAKAVTEPSSVTFKTALTGETAAWVWLAGVLLILFYILLVNGLLLLKSRQLRVCRDESVLTILEKGRASLNIQTKVAVVYDDTLRSPALFGLFRPRIIISPELISRLTPDELRYIFLHELSHCKRHDLFTNMLVTCLQAVYWFNPLIWYALHQMKKDCEMACDATALAVVQPEEHKRYGHTILDLLQLFAKPKLVSGTIGFTGKFQARRIRMIASFPKTTMKWAVVTLALTLLVGCASLSSPLSPLSPGSPDSNQAGQQSAPDAALNSSQNTPASPTTPAAENPVNLAAANNPNKFYQNTIYGFALSLPPSWPSYTTVHSRWQGDDVKTGAITATGEQIALRDSRWTAENPRQDIPIMIFTIKQWDLLQQGKFHIGAAPINPSELGRNSSYVFALPARYNYAFPTGYQEVEQLLANHPLQTLKPEQPVPSDDANILLVLNMARLASAGEVMANNQFPAKTNTIDDVEKAWGKPDSSDYVAAANGTYATYKSRQAAFGFNQQGQIFEVRSFDPGLKRISPGDVKTALNAPPAYFKEYNGQTIFGYTAGSVFKIEFVFSLTPDGKDSALDHYNVLYAQGTDAPGREW
jgi:beta-lactamase regulating signal transducer with metallopeptidase domain